MGERKADMRTVKASIIALTKFRATRAVVVRADFVADFQGSLAGIDGEVSVPAQPVRDCILALLDARVLAEEAWLAGVGVDVS